MIQRIFSGIGSFMQTPSGIVVSITAFWHIVMWGMGIPINWFISAFLLIIDFIFINFALDRLTYFYSQFILPVQNVKHRREIFNRVRMFESGFRGPAYFIKNGEVIMHEGEDKKRGPGLIVLDSASALVLRTDSEIKDTAGPGIKFIKPNEYIANSVDLRAQMQFIGPLPEDESEADAPEASERRESTVGLTRDGFEVAPRISVKFSIKKPAKNKRVPTESGVLSNYGYDEEAVRNAITGEVMHFDEEGNPMRLDWKNLPAHLVVNLWREYIRKFKISELFNMGAAENGLQMIESMLNKRVQNKDVTDLDDTGTRMSEVRASREFEQLQERGLEIQEIRIHNIYFDEMVENKIVEQWKADWQLNAMTEEKQIKEIDTLIEAFARDDAGKKFVKTATSEYADETVALSRNPFVALQLIIKPIREDLVSGNYVHSEIEKTLKKLEDVWKWAVGNAGNVKDKP